MNISKKQVFGTSGVAGVVGVIAVLVYSIFFTGDGITFAVSVDYDGNLGIMQTALSVFPDGTVAMIQFNVAGELTHGDLFKLMGDADFTAIKGDKLYLNKVDGIWIEIGRRLVQ
jgi:hypothetical protein